MYEYLHSTFPCDNSRPQKERETRLRHGELQIRDDLSQDCIDAYRALLEQDPQSRSKTEDLATLPWFSGFYLDTNHTFKNALFSPFCPRRYSHRQFDFYKPPRLFHAMSVICYGNPITSDVNSLYRCFAEWEYGDQHRWQDIRMRALHYYRAFMQGRVYSGNRSEDAVKQAVYHRIDNQIPQGVIHHLQTTNERVTDEGIIRIIADALHCQAVVMSWVGGSEGYKIKIYGNIHDKEIPDYFQIHLHYDSRPGLFELVMMHSEASRYQYKAHTRLDVELDLFVLDEDHKDILAEKQTAGCTEGDEHSDTMFSDSWYRFRQSGGITNNNK
jgi:hypothetical protein